MALNPTHIVTEIGRTVASVAQTDLALLHGYSRAKARAIAGYTLLIGEAHAAGQLSEADLAEEMEELDRMLARFVRNIEALASTLIERLLTAVAGVLRRVLDIYTVPPSFTLAALAAA